MPCHSQRSECAKVSTVPERYQTERDNDKENGLLMDVPAKEERCVAAKRHCTDESFPSGSKHESDKERLYVFSDGIAVEGRRTHHLKAHSKQETCQRHNFRKHSERRISNKPSRHTVDSLPINIQTKVWRHCNYQPRPELPR